MLSSVVIWFLSSFGTVNGKFGMVDNMFEDETIATEDAVSDIAYRMNVPEEEVTPMDASLLAGVGNTASVIFRPLGFGTWKPTVATVTGLVAKEQVVGTFGVLYNYDEEAAGEELGENGEGIWSRVAADFTPLAALAFMSGDGRDQARDEQREVDVGGNRLHVPVGICACPDRLSARLTVHRWQLRSGYYRCDSASCRYYLPALPQGLSAR